MSKNHDNRRKLHAAQLAKQVNHQNEQNDSIEGDENAFLSQYKVIREDLMKLREDLGRGYDMAKDAVDKRTILSEIMKLRESL